MPAGLPHARQHQRLCRTSAAQSARQRRPPKCRQQRRASVGSAAACSLSEQCTRLTSTSSRMLTPSANMSDAAVPTALLGSLRYARVKQTNGTQSICCESGDASAGGGGAQQSSPATSRDPAFNNAVTSDWIAWIINTPSGTPDHNAVHRRAIKTPSHSISHLHRLRLSRSCAAAAGARCLRRRSRTP
jgi:hypothetical protein